jgi:hypothetical protein
MSDDPHVHKQIIKKVILNIVQKHNEEISLLNTSKIGVRARQSTTLQYMRLMDHETLIFNNAAVFLDIKKAFDTTWHSGLLQDLSKLKFSTSLIKLISSSFHNANSVFQ